MDNPTLNETKQALIKMGWELCNRELDLDYLLKLPPATSLVALAKFSHTVVKNVLNPKEHIFTNVLSLMGDEVRRAFEDCWDVLTPPLSVAGSVLDRRLQHSCPEQRVHCYDVKDQMEDALKEHLVDTILVTLGQPNRIYQRSSSAEVYRYPVERFTNWRVLTCLGNIFIHWDNGCCLKVESEYSYNVGAYVQTATLSAPADLLNSLVQTAAAGVGVNYFGSGYKIGRVQAQHNIESYAALDDRVEQIADQLEQEISTANLYSVLLSGPPGTGKSNFCQAFAQERLRDYTTFILDYETFRSFVPPSYINRVAIILNDVDNVGLSRENSDSNGLTEKVLSVLDGTLYHAIAEPNAPKDKRVVFMLTCNQTDRLDHAMLRQGRISRVVHLYKPFVSCTATSV